jgi:hypothetical protein
VRHLGAFRVPARWRLLKADPRPEASGSKSGSKLPHSKSDKLDVAFLLILLDRFRDFIDNKDDFSRTRNVDKKEKVIPWKPQCD